MTMILMLLMMMMADGDDDSDQMPDAAYADDGNAAYGCMLMRVALMCVIQ